jgi:hypothetical protein
MSLKDMLYWCKLILYWQPIRILQSFMSYKESREKWADMAENMIMIGWQCKFFYGWQKIGLWLICDQGGVKVKNDWLIFWHESLRACRDGFISWYETRHVVGGTFEISLTI